MFSYCWTKPARDIARNPTIKSGTLVSGFAPETPVLAVSASSHGGWHSADVYVQTPATQWDGFRVRLYTVSFGIEALADEALISSTTLETTNDAAGAVTSRQGIIVGCRNFACEGFRVRIQSTSAVTDVENAGLLTIEAWGPAV